MSSDEIQKTEAIQKTLSAFQKTLSALSKPGEKPVGPSDAARKPGDQVSAGGKTYTVEKVLGSGSEGDIYVVTDGKRRAVLKLCHPGFTTNAKVLKRLEHLKGKGYIADILEYGPDYELMEYFPEGSAATAGLKGNADAILAIALKIAITLDEIHKSGVIHKDVKPANILVRQGKGGMDCVLCDFGISDEIDDRGTSVTKQLRTPIYAAPEIYTDTVTLPEGTFIELSPKADFYSLGMTILSLWMGEGAFDAKEPQLAIDKKKGRIAIPADMPDPLAKICRGLLIKNPAKRWDYPEIEATVRGKDDISVEEDEIIADLNITYNASKHQIANTPRELARLMLEDESGLAVKYLYRGQVERWLRTYPELALEVQEIVEKRYPQDQNTGLFATVFFLDPTIPFPLSGASRTDASPVAASAVTLKDVSNFCNGAIVDQETANRLSGNVFTEWVRVRSAAIAGSFPPSGDTLDIYMLRVQLLDPLSDINLVNDPSNPDYAMTQEGLGRLFNHAYNIFWGVAGGDISHFASTWKIDRNNPLTLRFPVETVLNIASNFLAPEDYHYVTESMDTKAGRFQKQRSWFVYCTDRNSDDYRKKCGPKDDASRAQAAWMKVIKGFGVTPELQLSNGHVVDSLQTMFAEPPKVLRKDCSEGGLRGFLAVHHQEDPNVDYKPQFTYERRLKGYLDDLRRIDPGMTPVTRFDYARKEADKLLASGKRKIQALNVRSVLQIVSAVLFCALPLLIMLTMLIFSIVENPIIDVRHFKLENWTWLLGLVLAGVLYFVLDTEGCLIPIVLGIIGGFLIMIIIKILGQFILYIFAALIIAVLVFLCLKVLFFRSPFSDSARKFTRPGFDEKVLEPLDYAFSDAKDFDSSLNGAFNDNDLKWWQDDLKIRLRRILVFVGATIVFAIFMAFIPKSEKFSGPVKEKVEIQK